ncbi:MAG: hypothetical protein R3B99_05715 [Polyangiales bacterium]
MNANQQALVDRWQSFLAKIHERLAEICVEAEAGVRAIAAQHPEDQMPVSNAITGLDHRVRQLREKIQETWDAQVEDKFSADPEIHDVGLDMKQDSEVLLDEKWSLAKAAWMSEIAREAFGRAMAAMEKPVPCSSCGAPLNLPTRIELVAATCTHCGVVNQAAPSMAIQYYFGWCVQNLADAAALPHRHAVERQRIVADRWRRDRNWAAEPVESLEEWERLERRYWETVAHERARLRNEPVDQKYIDSRMAYFYKYSLESNQQWVRAKGRHGG